MWHGVLYIQYLLTMAVPGDPAGRKCTRRGPPRSLVAASSELPRCFRRHQKYHEKIHRFLDAFWLHFGSQNCLLLGSFFNQTSTSFFIHFFIDICSLQGPLLGSNFHNFLLNFGLVFASWFHLFLDAILNQFWSYFGSPQTFILLLSPRRRANFRVFGMLQNMSKFNKKCIQNCIPNQWKICSNGLKTWV